MYVWLITYSIMEIKLEFNCHFQLSGTRHQERDWENKIDYFRYNSSNILFFFHDRNGSIIPIIEISRLQLSNLLLLKTIQMVVYFYDIYRWKTVEFFVYVFKKKKERDTTVFGVLIRLRAQSIFFVDSPKTSAFGDP